MMQPTSKSVVSSNWLEISEMTPPRSCRLRRRKPPYPVCKTVIFVVVFIVLEIKRSKDGLAIRVASEYWDRIATGRKWQPTYRAAACCIGGRSRAEPCRIRTRVLVANSSEKLLEAPPAEKRVTGKVYA